MATADCSSRRATEHLSENNQVDMVSVKIEPEEEEYECGSCCGASSSVSEGDTGSSNAMSWSGHSSGTADDSDNRMYTLELHPQDSALAPASTKYAKLPTAPTVDKGSRNRSVCVSVPSVNIKGTTKEALLHSHSPSNGSFMVGAGVGISESGKDDKECSVYYDNSSSSSSSSSGSSSSSDLETEDEERPPPLIFAEVVEGDEGTSSAAQIPSSVTAADTDDDFSSFTQVSLFPPAEDFMVQPPSVPHDTEVMNLFNSLEDDWAGWAGNTDVNDFSDLMLFPSEQDPLDLFPSTNSTMGDEVPSVATTSPSPGPRSSTMDAIMTEDSGSFIEPGFTDITGSTPKETVNEVPPCSMFAEGIETKPSSSISHSSPIRTVGPINEPEPIEIQISSDDKGQNVRIDVSPPPGPADEFSLLKIVDEETASAVVAWVISCLFPSPPTSSDSHGVGSGNKKRKSPAGSGERSNITENDSKKRSRMSYANPNVNENSKKGRKPESKQREQKKSAMIKQTEEEFKRWEAEWKKEKEGKTDKRRSGRLKGKCAGASGGSKELLDLTLG